MKSNVHNYERVLRIVVGLGILSLFFFDPSNLWYLLGLVPLLTGLVGWCPPYALFGISTKKSCDNCATPGKAA